jgi:hypothetical protein
MSAKTNCGVGSITFGGAHHVLLQAVFEDGHDPTATLCGTTASSGGTLFDDEWGFEDIYKAMEYAETCARPCKRCRRAAAQAKAISRRANEVAELEAER